MTPTEVAVAQDVTTFRQPEWYLRHSKIGIESQMASCAANELPEVKLWLHSMGYVRHSGREVGGRVAGANRGYGLDHSGYVTGPHSSAPSSVHLAPQTLAKRIHYSPNIRKSQSYYVFSAHCRTQVFYSVTSRDVHYRLPPMINDHTIGSILP